MRALNITKNTIALTMREALNKGSIFILLILIGRFMGREALGSYSLAFAISQIFFFGAELGLNTLVIREVAKNKSIAGKALVNIGLVRCILGLLTLLLIWITVAVLKAKGEAAVVIYLCALSYFFVNLINLYTSIFRAFEKMELDLLAAVIKSVIYLPAALWLVFNKAGLIPLFNLFLISNLTTLVITHFIFVKQIGPPKLEPDISFCKFQLSQTSSLWFAQIFGIMYLKLAPIMLFRLRGVEAVGLYNAAYVIVDVCWVISSCFAYALFPIISHLSAISVSDAAREYLKNMKLVSIIFVISGAIFILTAQYVVPFFYGQKFAEIIPLFRVLAIASILVAVDTHNNLTIIAIGRQSILPFINFAALTVNFIFNAIFISRFNYLGAGYAFVLTEAAVFASMVMVLKRNLLNVKPSAVKLK